MDGFRRLFKPFTCSAAGSDNATAPITPTPPATPQKEFDFARRFAAAFKTPDDSSIVDDDDDACSKRSAASVPFNVKRLKDAGPALSIWGSDENNDGEGHDEEGEEEEKELQKELERAEKMLSKSDAGRADEAGEEAPSERMLEQSSLYQHRELREHECQSQDHGQQHQQQSHQQLKDKLAEDKSTLGDKPHSIQAYEEKSTRRVHDHIMSWAVLTRNEAMAPLELGEVEREMDRLQQSFLRLEMALEEGKVRLHNFKLEMMLENSA